MNKANNNNNNDDDDHDDHEGEMITIYEEIDKIEDIVGGLQ